VRCSRSFPLSRCSGSSINAVVGRRLSKTVSGGLASLVMLASFAVSAMVVWQLASLPSPSASIEQTLYTWIASDDFTLALDASASTRWRRDDPRRHRHRLADSHLLDRLHARRGRQRVRARTSRT
jgi:glutathione S-transferase